jgi:hypothetical protein
MRRGIAAGVVALATVVAHCSLVFAQAAGQQGDRHATGQPLHGPLPAPSRGTPAVNPPPSTQRRFESTLKFDPRQRDDVRRAFPGPGFRFGAPFVFVTPFWLSDEMIRSGDIGDAQLRLPLPSGLPPGGVQLDVQPWRAHVYVDGAYAGLVEDFKGYYRHLEISAGPHVIVIVTPGYEPLVVELRVSPGQVTTYRGTLNFALPH